MNWNVIAFIVGGYLFGAIPTGLLVGRLLKGVDIREFGSGKIGMTNTLRTLGPRAAALVFAGDVLKGALPVLVAKAVTGDASVEVAVALAAIVGHDWPVYAGFRGGRGVSTSFGATAAMMPLLAPVMLLLAGLILLPFRYVSLASMAATVISALLVFALAATDRVPGPYVVYAIGAATLIVVLHRDNIRRLLAGVEPKLGQGGSKRAAPAKKYVAGGRSR